ncbi:hypothetical protein BH23BAC1_BH23BAC1_05740 [soil metagenome]
MGSPLLKMKKHFKILKHLFDRFYGLSLSDKLLLMEVGVLLAFLRFILKFIPLNRIYPLLKKNPSKPVYNYKDQLNYTSRIIWAVEKSGKYLLKKKCLAQALAVHLLLNKKRIKNELEIGFIRNRNNYSAHAWIKSGDKVLIGDNQRLHLYFRIPLMQSKVL